MNADGNAEKRGFLMATQTGEDLLYKDISYHIRGACFDVWKIFGGAFKEKVVDNALSEALRKRGLVVENQKRLDIFYEGKKVGTYIPDKVINDVILMELKSKPFLTREDERQFWLYLKASKYKVGMLVNFSPEKLEVRRRVFDKARDLPRSSASLSA